MKRVYISGAITNCACAELMFEKAYRELNDQNLGDFDAVSPYSVGDQLFLDMSHQEYMSVDMEILAQADYIALLPGWEHSFGAMAERRMADQLGLGLIVIKTNKNSWESFGIDDEWEYMIKREPEPVEKRIKKHAIRNARTRAILEELREHMRDLLVLHLNKAGEELNMDDILYNSGVRAAMQLVKDALGDTSGIRWEKRQVTANGSNG